MQGLLNKKPSERLGWPQLLHHPFVRETSSERLKREAALADATRLAQHTRSWKGEGGAIAGVDPPPSLLSEPPSLSFARAPLRFLHHSPPLSLEADFFV
jgi:hypothetical protein